MGLIWILLVCLVPIIVIIPTHIVGIVSMCENNTYTGTNIQISRIKGESANCTCLLQSTEEISTKVYFNMTSLNGCKYKLTVYFKEKMSYYSCNPTNSIFEEITSDIIKLNLEPNNENGDKETSFILNISTKPETNLTLSCFVPKITKPSTTPFISTTIKSTFSTSRESGISNRQTDSTKTTESEQSTSFTRDAELNSTVPVFPTVHENSSLNSTVYYTQNTASPRDASMYSFSTISETEATTTNNLTASPLDAASGQKYNHGDDEESDDVGNHDDGNDEVVTAGVIGGIIGGVIVGGLIFTVIGILKYRKRSKKSSSEIYSTPQHHLPESQYTDLQLSPQNTRNNSS